MNKVIFEMEDGSRREFDGDKFTEEHIKSFNNGSCTQFHCESCPLNGIGKCNIVLFDVKKCYHQQNKCEECENKMPLIRNMLSCSCCADSPELKSNFKKKKKLVKKEVEVFIDPSAQNSIFGYFVCYKTEGPINFRTKAKLVYEVEE